MAVGGRKATFEKNTHRRLNTQIEIKYQDANRCKNLSTGEKRATAATYECGYQCGSNEDSTCQNEY